MEDAKLIFAHRLRTIRTALGFSQEKVGVTALGLPPDVARTRLSRYETGVNECDLRTAKKIADALGVPLAALFSDTDEIADVIVAFSKLPIREQRSMLDELKARIGVA